MAAKLNDFDGVKSSARDDGNGGLVTDIHLKSQEKPLQVDFPQAGFSSFKTDKFTVTSTAQKVTAGITDRTALTIYPPAEGTIYIGNSTVTADTGIPLTAGDKPFSVPVAAGKTLYVYVINDGTDRDVRVFEAK
ncbi:MULTISPECIES: hypothetical protein [Bacillus]|uniref:hypothetical protein n=1 Tax=Bacillus TaxID=1386 RepID=UPI0009881E80|nr:MULTISPECIES: hypothetical protein [Bacillus amyloliquefaciens group]AQS44093.1 hypothetical protein BVH55_09325 [Bacillus velezensis]MBG9464223.1 hypothetical protein [Bacillus amyloliquefaciens]MEC5261224.1 hypothetical protein [Bacillus amyloliquefaciens]WNR79526.1 hypothetical protein RP314_11490 [Bacillus velezensis]